MPRDRHRPTSRHGGQSAVETLVVVPALVLVAAVAWWLVAGAALWLQAGSAARAGARAAAVAADPRAAAVAGAAGFGGHVSAVRTSQGPVAVRVTITTPGPLGIGRVRIPVQAEAWAP